MDNQQKPPQNEIKQEMQFSRNEAKLYLLHSLSSPTAIPMLAIWFDPKTGGWSFVRDNDLQKQKVPREAVARILFDLIATLKLFDEISVKAD